MKIDFQLTEQDYIDFNVYHMENSKTIKKSVFIQRYIISLIFLIAPFVFYNFADIPFSISMAIFGIIYVIWIAFYPQYLKKSVAKRISKMLEEGNNSDFLGSHSISLTEEGLEESSRLGETKKSWSAIERIDITEAHIFIYASAVSAYIIPTRAFENMKQIDEFIDMLNKMKEGNS